MVGLPPTNKIRGLAIRVGSSQRLPCCAPDDMPRRALAFGGSWNHSDGFSKRFAKCEEMEKAGADYSGQAPKAKNTGEIYTH